MEGVKFNRTPEIKVRHVQMLRTGKVLLKPGLSSIENAVYIKTEYAIPKLAAAGKCGLKRATFYRHLKAYESGVAVRPKGRPAIMTPEEELRFGAEIKKRNRSKGLTFKDLQKLVCSFGLPPRASALFSPWLHSLGSEHRVPSSRLRFVEGLTPVPDDAMILLSDAGPHSRSFSSGSQAHDNQPLTF